MIDYYSPPTKEIFEEVKRKAIDIWSTYDNTYGYADEKIHRIIDIKNVRDNFMYMVAMFDLDNQESLAEMISDEARLAIRERMLEGGTPEEYIVF